MDHQYKLYKLLGLTASVVLVRHPETTKKDGPPVGRDGYILVGHTVVTT